MNPQRMISVVFRASLLFVCAVLLTQCRFRWSARDENPLERQTQVEQAQKGVPIETQRNAQIVHEMHLVVFGKRMRDVVAFNNYLNGLSDGGSVVSIYNGFIYSDRFRSLEMTSPPVFPETLSIAGKEIKRIDEILGKTIEFTGVDLKPLPLPTQPTSDPVELQFAADEEDRLASQFIEKKNWSAKDYSSLFVGVPFFTIKRTLARKYLDMIGDLQSQSKDLFKWYGNWAVSTLSYGVPFGIPQRSKSDPQYHMKWARTAGVDRMTWEVLNRIHRLLNQANGVKIDK